MGESLKMHPSGTSILLDFIKFTNTLKAMVRGVGGNLDDRVMELLRKKENHLNDKCKMHVEH